MNILDRHTQRYRSPVPPQKEPEIVLDLACRDNTRAIRERAAHIETPGEPSLPVACALHELAPGFEKRKHMALVEQYTESRR